MKCFYCKACIAMTLCLMLTASGVEASSSEERFRHADKNKDGILDKHELEAEREGGHRQQVHSCGKDRSRYDGQTIRMQHRWEQQHAQYPGYADKSRHRGIDRSQIKMERKREYMKNRQVKTWWEERADTDNDGILSHDELAAWKKMHVEKDA